MSSIPIETLKKNLSGGGGEVFYPLTSTDAVENGNNKKLSDILEDTINNMGDAFSEQASYEVGDYCIYQDVLYKFIAAKNAGAWDSTKVGQTTIEAELKSLFNQVSELNSGWLFEKAKINTEPIVVPANSDASPTYRPPQKTGYKAVLCNVLTFGAINRVFATFSETEPCVFKLRCVSTGGATITELYTCTLYMKTN